MKDVKPPFVVMGNHASRYDFAIAALSIKKYRIHVVTATVFYFNPIARWLLNALACVPKLQMVSDPVSVRRMLEVVRNDGVLTLFPHGQVSYDGKDMPMPQGTGKLIKHMNVPVVNIKIQGAGLTRPKWGLKPRRGRILADVDVLFTPEKIQTMSAKEIDEAIRKTLAFNDYNFSRETRIPYACKNRTEKLEQLLYQCPRCHALYHMRSREDTIECGACHNGARMDAFGLLHPLHEGDVIFEDPVAWTAFQRDMAKAYLRKEGRLQQDVSLYAVSEERPKFSLCGSGILTLTRNDMCFEGEKDGKPFSFSVPNKQMVALPFSFDKGYWELPGAKEYYRLFPKQRLSIMRMALMLEAAHALKQEGE